MSSILSILQVKVKKAALMHCGKAQKGQFVRSGWQNN